MINVKLNRKLLEQILCLLQPNKYKKMKKFTIFLENMGIVFYYVGMDSLMMITYTIKYIYYMKMIRLKKWVAMNYLNLIIN